MEIESRLRFEVSADADSINSMGRKLQAAFGLQMTGKTERVKRDAQSPKHRRQSFLAMQIYFVPRRRFQAGSSLDHQLNESKAAI